MPAHGATHIHVITGVTGYGLIDGPVIYCKLLKVQPSLLLELAALRPHFFQGVITFREQKRLYEVCTTEFFFTKHDKHDSKYFRIGKMKW